MGTFWHILEEIGQYLFSHLVTLFGSHSILSEYRRALRIWSSKLKVSDLFVFVFITVLSQVQVGHVKVVGEKAVDGLLDAHDTRLKGHQRLLEGQNSSEHRVRRVAHGLLQQHVQNGLDQAQVPVELTRHSLNRTTRICCFADSRGRQNYLCKTCHPTFTDIFWSTRNWPKMVENRVNQKQLFQCQFHWLFFTDISSFN